MDNSVSILNFQNWEIGSYKVKIFKNFPCNTYERDAKLLFLPKA